MYFPVNSYKLSNEKCHHMAHGGRTPGAQARSSRTVGTGGEEKMESKLRLICVFSFKFLREVLSPLCLCFRITNLP